MEATTIFVFIGAIIGVGLGLLGLSMDLIFTTSIMTEERFGGLVLLCAVGAPFTAFIIMIADEYLS